jgi:hypothetical protein
LRLSSSGQQASPQQALFPLFLERKLPEFLAYHDHAEEYHNIVILRKSGAKKPHFEAEIVKKRLFRRCFEGEVPVFRREWGILMKSVGLRSKQATQAKNSGLDGCDRAMQHSRAVINLA